jgi:hypothetical protein
MRWLKQKDRENVHDGTISIQEKARFVVKQYEISMNVKKNTSVEILNQNTGEILFRMVAITGTHQLLMSNKIQTLLDGSDHIRIRVV